MQDLLIFFITTLIFWLAGMFLTNILFAMMQDGGAFDVVFGWGKLRDSLYQSNKPLNRLIENAIGGCEQCTSFWFMPFWTGIYYGFCKLRITWITDGLHWPAAIAVDVIWLIVFWAVGAGIGHYYLIYKQRNNVV